MPLPISSSARLWFCSTPPSDCKRFKLLEQQAHATFSGKKDAQYQGADGSKANPLVRGERLRALCRRLQM